MLGNVAFEVDVKAVFPRLFRQRSRLDFGHADAEIVERRNDRAQASAFMWQSEVEADFVGIWQQKFFLCDRDEASLVVLGITGIRH